MSQIYSLLNDVKTDLDLYDREELTDIEIQKIKNSIKNNKSKKSGRVMATAACAAIAVFLIGNTAFADEIHVAAKSIEWQIGNFLGIDKELQDYVTVLNTSQTDKGYTITLNEVVLDENELIVCSTIKSEEPINDFSFMADEEIYVNGKNAFASSGGGSKQIDEYTIESVINYKLENVDTKQKLDIEINYNRIGREEDGVKGNWDFRFLADGSALAIDTLHIPLDAVFTLPNGEKIQLSEYASNNLGEKIKFTVLKAPENNTIDYDMQLEGEDDLGNKVDFYLSYMNGEEGTGCFKTSDPINENAKSITLKPCAVKFPETDGQLSDDFQPVGEEFTIDLSNTVE